MNATATTFRKSWMIFVRQSVYLLIWIAIFISVFIYQAQWSTSLIRGGLSPRAVEILFLVIKLLVGLAILRIIWRLFWLRSYRIHIGDDIVAVRSGLLPWTKFQRSWDGDQMHECLVDTKGLIGWVTKSGDLQIVGSEGSTHKYWMRDIGQAERACAAINDMRRKSRALRRGQG